MIKIQWQTYKEKSLHYDLRDELWEYEYSVLCQEFTYSLSLGRKRSEVLRGSKIIWGGSREEAHGEGVVLKYKTLFVNLQYLLYYSKWGSLICTPPSWPFKAADWWTVTD